MFDVNAYVCILRERKIPFELFDTNSVRDGFEDDDLPDPQGKIVSNFLLVNKDGERALLTKTSKLDIDEYIASHPEAGYRVEKFASLEEELNPLDLCDFEYKGMPFFLEKELLNEKFMLIYTRDMGVVIDVAVKEYVEYLKETGTRVELI